MTGGPLWPSLFARYVRDTCTAPPLLLLLLRSWFSIDTTMFNSPPFVRQMRATQTDVYRHPNKKKLKKNLPQARGCGNDSPKESSDKIQPKTKILSFLIKRGGFRSSLGLTPGYYTRYTVSLYFVYLLFLLTSLVVFSCVCVFVTARTPREISKQLRTLHIHAARRRTSVKTTTTSKPRVQKNAFDAVRNLFFFFEKAEATSYGKEK